MPVIYVDFRTAPVEDRDYISEFTWLVENEYGLDPRHYFVDYPGAKDLERLVTSVVGGSPMVRYSYPIVLRTFLDSIEEGYIIAFKNAYQKELFSELLETAKLTTTFALCLLSDITTLDNEVERVLSSIEEARTNASRTFGNAL